MSITLVLIIVTSLVSYQCFNDRGLFQKLLHNPYTESKKKEYYRILTCGFVHGDWTHLIINMYVLYMFGDTIENAFTSFMGPLNGRLGYIALYILGIIFSSLPTHAKHRNNPSFSSVGASGAVSAIVFAFILIHPWAQLLLFFIIPIPAIIFGILYLVYSSWASKNSNTIIDHDAHFYGALFGIVFTLLINQNFLTRFLNEIQNVPSLGEMFTF